MIALHLRLRMIAYSQSALKRLFDLAVSFAVLPIALPAMVFGAILVVLTTGGTFIYRQSRVGRNNR